MKLKGLIDIGHWHRDRTGYIGGIQVIATYEPVWMPSPTHFINQHAAFTYCCLSQLLPTPIYIGPLSPPSPIFLFFTPTTLSCLLFSVQASIIHLILLSPFFPGHGRRLGRCSLSVGFSIAGLSQPPIQVPVGSSLQTELGSLDYQAGLVGSGAWWVLQVTC